MIQQPTSQYVTIARQRLDQPKFDVQSAYSLVCSFFSVENLFTECLQSWKSASILAADNFRLSDRFGYFNFASVLHLPVVPAVQYS